jgi:hypothetical protein
MSTKTIHDILLEAQAMQREGLRPRQIAAHLGELEAENGLTPNVTIGSGDKITHQFASGEAVQWDGHAWHHLRPG